MPEDLSVDSIGACLGKYPTIGRLYQFAPLEGPFHNVLYHVTAPAGEFYLKVLTTHFVHTTEERWEYIASVMGRAASLDVELPFPIRNDANSLLTPCGRYLAELSKAVPGAPFESEDLEHQRAAGELLGHFHQATRDFTPRGTTWLRGIGGYLLLDPGLRERLPQAREAEVIREHFDELQQRSCRIAHELASSNLPDLPRTVVHSEFTAKHLRMGGARVTGLLDFEYTNRDVRCLDIALALRGLSCLGVQVGGADAERCAAFIGGYDSAGWPLEAAERRAVPLIGETWDLECITFWAHYMADTGCARLGFDMADQIRTHWPRAEWWRANRAECASLLLDLSPSP